MSFRFCELERLTYLVTLARVPDFTEPILHNQCDGRGGTFDSSSSSRTKIAKTKLNFFLFDSVLASRY